MDRDRLNWWLTILANVGMLGGIVFVGFEIRQNTSQLRAGFEGIDPTLNVCLTVHNPTQAGSQTGTFASFGVEDSGASQAGSVITKFRN